MNLRSRKLLQDDGIQISVSPSLTYYNTPEPHFRPTNDSSSTTVKRHPVMVNPPHTPFDSSMALTILVLLTALFFMGFFSIYIRRFAGDPTAGDASRRRRNHPRHGSSSSSSSSNPQSRFVFNRRKGLDPSAVRSLPVVPYGGAAKYRIDCVVCLSEFEEREAVKMIPYCGHVFHPRCIDTWLESHATCPVCRTAQIFVAEEEGEESCFRATRSRLGCGGTEPSTVIEVEGGAGDMGTVGIRRTRSCSSLGGGCTVLQRTLSF